MDPKLHGTTSDAGKRKEEGWEDSMEQVVASNIPHFINTNANMTNCYDQCALFFERFKTIHFNGLIAYWMMAGYLGPIGAVEEALQRGQDMLDNLIQDGMLQIAADGDMIEFVESEQHLKHIHCKHEGFCAPEAIRFVDDDVRTLRNIGNIMLTDGMLQRKVIDENQDLHPERLSRFMKVYSAHFNPIPDSVNPLLEKDTEPISLVLRGCGGLLPPTTFPLEMLRSLHTLEISGSAYFTAIPADTISQLYRLDYLNLSDLLIQSLPDEFFSQLGLRWLILRRCSKLRSLPEISNGRLHGLDLSHCTALQEIQSINFSGVWTVDLSYTALTEMPRVSDHVITHLFLRDSKLSDLNCFGVLDRLQVLDLSGAMGVTHLDAASSSVPEVLDLSTTPIEYLDLASFTYTKSPLRCLVLQECTSLKQLPPMKYQLNLEVLDVSGCVKLVELPEDLSRLNSLRELNLCGCSGLGSLTQGVFDQMSSLLKLDLSGTKLKVLPSSLVNLTSLSKLSLRGLELHSIEPIASLSSLVELDLKGLEVIPSRELRLDFLQSFENLGILNLSETSVAQLPDLSKLVSLKVLLLANCQFLEVVPDLQPLTNLETLDLSLPDDSTCQLEIQGMPISAPNSLRKLNFTNRSNLFALTSLDNLEFRDATSRVGNHQEATDQDDYLQLQGRASKPAEIHIVCDTCIPWSNTLNKLTSFDFEMSVFKQWRNILPTVEAIISELQDDLDAATTDEDASDPSVTANVKNHAAFKLQLLHSDLNYIVENIERLEGSKNSNTCEELLKELTEAIPYLSAADFLDDSIYLMQFLRIVLKLKVSVPPKPAERLKALEVTKKGKEEKFWFKRSINKEDDDVCSVKESSSHDFQDLLSSYGCLSSLQKCCLLCFSGFPLDEDIVEGEEPVLKSLVIKKRILIYLWAGEGFLDDPSGVTSSQPVEETGKDVFMVLADKGFVEPVMEKGRETGSCCMHPFVHSFVTAKAKEEGFFDFSRKSGKLAPHFTRSQRACLLESQGNLPSSCKLWADYAYYRNNQERFKTVRTLFNVTESVVDVKPEWLSKMKHLRVLHLGSWREDHVEVHDDKFLEESGKMKSLRLLSLQGLSGIIKLPDSVCKLASLIILDLRECNDLEELPADIGSLKSLTHLDLTNCRHMIELPKGIRLLLNLEVLKGFVITKQGCCGPQNTKICLLQDLLSLKKLSKFNIVAKVNVFPGDKELQVLKDMNSLRKLKITWEKDFNFSKEEWSSPAVKDAVAQELAIRPWKWEKLKCWERRSSQDDGEETPSRSQNLDNIEKLELLCYPFETPPYWLNPTELATLKKLYIRGGKLAKLHCGTNHNYWNVTTLRLRYMCNLHLRWADLNSMFPNLTYLERHQCPNLPPSPSLR